MTGSGNARVPLELDDIQSGALHARPTPYSAHYSVLRIDDGSAGRQLLQQLLPAVGTTSPDGPQRPWVSVGFSYQGLKALGVPQDSLASFPEQFRQGMAARAAILGDTGESAPEHWEKPFGTQDVRVVVSALSPDAAGLEYVLARARKAIENHPGITPIWKLDAHVLPTGREAFGFKDGIGQPAVEGSGIPGTDPKVPALKAGEFDLLSKEAYVEYVPTLRDGVRQLKYWCYVQAAASAVELLFISEDY